MAAQKVIHRSGDEMHSERWPDCAMPPRDTNWHKSGHMHR
jgi:hypothetical protein